MSRIGLQLEKITKLFGAFKALDQVDLNVVDGSVHAVLGENGAGKTTLMNILYGLYQPDGGRIILKGKETRVASPRRAMELGIGMIHQHFMLVDSLTVVENVALGLSGQGINLTLKAIAEKLSHLSDEFGFDIDPHTEIWKLPIGMRQRVEILKVLYRDADLIILDEPTSVLAPSEIGRFLDGLGRLRDAGKTIIFITHKLEEVEQICDRVTIMQHGKATAEAEIGATDARKMARLMVGRDMIFDEIERTDIKAGDIVLSASGLRAHDDRGLEALKGVSFDIRAGEILGVAGVDGNGQAELAEVLTGLRTADQGAVKVDGKDITSMSVHDRRHRIGMSFVPEDRQGTGLVLDVPVTDNAMLRDFKVLPFSRHGVLRRQTARQTAEDWVERYDVRLQSVDQHVRFLSGGNQQKLIFAREVECDPKVIIVMQPCKGLDVGAIEAVQKTILEQRAKGKAILYISTELEHILAVCDRMAVMCAGKITGIVTPKETTSERIGALMGGLSDEEVA